MTTFRRPSPWQWLRYSVGAGLPPDLKQWVLHDVTCRTWALRQVMRSLLVVSPLVVLLLAFVPGPFWIRGMSALGGIIMSLIFALGYLVETTEHRLVKAGYSAGAGEEIREQRATGQRSAATARRRQKMFDRIDKRGR
jgi:hypothetical protein